MTMIEGVVAVADVANNGGVVYTMDELRKFHNGKTLFFEEQSGKLVYRGPMLEYEEEKKYMTISLREFMA